MPDEPYSARRGAYCISTDRARLNLDMIHGYLTRSYWAVGIPREVVVRCVEHSLCFGLYHGEQQVGFARVITDFTRLAHLADVFVLEAHRGHGLGKWLVETVLAHPALQTIQKWTLATRDAHTLYSRFGFEPLAHPESQMERVNPPEWAVPPESKQGG